MYYKNNQRGFSLIELMIVIAIISILTSIAVPAYQDYIKKAYLAAALVKMQILKRGLEIVIAEGNLDAVVGPQLRLGMYNAFNPDSRAFLGIEDNRDADCALAYTQIKHQGEWNLQFQCKFQKGPYGDELSPCAVVIAYGPLIASNYSLPDGVFPIACEIRVPAEDFDLSPSKDCHLRVAYC